MEDQPAAYPPDALVWMWYPVPRAELSLSMFRVIASWRDPALADGWTAGPWRYEVEPLAGGSPRRVAECALVPAVTGSVAA